jgi:hypothetical protein
MEKFHTLITFSSATGILTIGTSKTSHQSLTHLFIVPLFPSTAIVIAGNPPSSTLPMLATHARPTPQISPFNNRDDQSQNQNSASHVGLDG